MQDCFINAMAMVYHNVMYLHWEWLQDFSMHIGKQSSYSQMLCIYSYIWLHLEWNFINKYAHIWYSFYLHFAKLKSHDFFKRTCIAWKLTCQIKNATHGKMNINPFDGGNHSMAALLINFLNKTLWNSHHQHPEVVITYMSESFGRSDQSKFWGQ